MLKNISASIVTLLFFALTAQAQQGEEVLLPLHGNPFLKQATPQKNTFMRKSGITDTLLLPFFDDFSQPRVFPNPNRWTDVNAYINTDFAFAPPTVGIATLDGLDSTGKPYLNIRAGLRGPCDTLSSQPIDISTFNTGSNIFLSFFYQQQGLSFFNLSAADSLVLQFKGSNDIWYNQWSAKGASLGSFKPAIIKIDNARYFHAGFQFRFINYQEYLGGVGQWHIDYVYMERNRTANDTFFNDVAIAHKPVSFLRRYQTMPFNQYKGFEIAENLTTPQGYLSNLANVGRTVDNFNRQVRDDANNLIINSPRSGLAINAKTQQGYNFPSTLTTVALNKDTVTYTITEFMKITGANFRLDNDSVTRRITMGNWYAYDDGTAETGYGLRRGAGKIAYKFTLNKPDSLRAISIYFFQAEDTIKKPFALNVWKSITPNGDGENLIYSKTITAPTYTDSINGFFTYVLDSALFVTDSFYIGWTQNTSYMLNVGWDRNYILNNDSVANPALYFNTTGKWYTSEIKGTLMMRPHLGKSIKAPVQLDIPWVREQICPTLYPNPAQNTIYIKNLPQGNTEYTLADIAGKTMLQGSLNDTNNNTIDINYLPNGLYFLILQNTNQRISTLKFIKQ